MKLVDLRQMEIPAQHLTLSPGRFNRVSLMNECLALGFNSIVSIYDRWVQPFEQAVNS